MITLLTATLLECMIGRMFLFRMNGKMPGMSSVVDAFFAMTFENGLKIPLEGPMQFLMTRNIFAIM